MSTSAAFCLLFLGVSGVYCELLRPGHVWPGVAGIGAALAGGYFLWLASPVPLGLGLLAAAIVIFVLDAFVDLFNLPGIAATVSLAVGFTRLIAGPGQIQPLLASAASILFGALTMALNKTARRARRNKQLDLFA